MEVEIHSKMRKEICNVVFFKNLASPEPFLVKTTVKTKDDNGQPDLKMHSLPVLLPHEWVHSIDGRNMDHILGQEAAEMFWRKVDLKRPRLQACKSWLNTYKDIKKEAPIPFTFHGHGAPHSEIDSLLCFSVRSMLTQVSIAESQLLLFACPKACLEKPTVADVMKTLSWSFKALAAGKFPSKDPWGNGLGQAETSHGLQANPAESPKEKMHAEEFGMPRAMSDHPCGFCNCGMHDEIPFNDFRPEAKWKTTCFSAAEMAEKCSHELFTVLGLHPLGLYLDTLHTLDLV